MDSPPPSSHPHTTVQALERELSRVREKNQTQVAELQAEVLRLTDAKMASRGGGGGGRGKGGGGGGGGSVEAHSTRGDQVSIRLSYTISWPLRL